MKQRLEYIDIAKGIGIILVVLSHSEHWELMYYTSAFFVPIFFFCSGYTSARKNISLNTCFRRQAIKLLKPYLFFSILLLLCFHDFSLRAIAGIVYSRYCLYPFGTEPDICHFMIVGNYPMWFLTCMVIAYLLYDLLIYYPRYQYWLIGIYLVATTGATHLPILLPWSLDTAPLMAVVMYGGTMANRYLSPSMQKWEWTFIIPYLVLLPFCSDINISVRMYGFNMLTYLLAALTGCIVVIWLTRHLQGTLVGKGLQQIGVHSLTIFCIEIPFILIGKQLSVSILPEMSSLQTAIITSFIQLIIALTGGYLLSILLHKNEYIRKIVF
jgi:fucose 4-O-acetylase-like acetyltransferase